MNAGRLITLEGGEGAGKSTLARALVTLLQADGVPVVGTREPGGSPLAEAVRRLVIESWDEGVAPETEVLLMSAARAAHWRSCIAPALARGEWVICDRFIDSTHAYQGSAGVPEALIEAATRLAIGETRPDLTLLIDLDPEVGLARAGARGDDNRFEAAELARHHQIRASFRARAAAEPDRFVVIDGGQKEDAVQEQALSALRVARQRWSA